MNVKCVSFLLAVLLPLFIVGIVPATADVSGEWEVVHVFPQWLVLLDVACAGPDDVWVVGMNEQTDTNQIYYSNDGGETWVMQYSGMDLAVFLVGMDAADESSVYIAGTYVFAFPDAEGCGAMTRSGRIAWNPIPTADSFIASFRSVTARSPLEAHLVGGWGFSDIKGLYSTFDGGQSWTQYATIPASHAVLFADFAGEQDIWVTGGAWPEDEGRAGGYTDVFEPHVRRALGSALDGFTQNMEQIEEPSLESGVDSKQDFPTRTGQYESSIWYSGNAGASWTQQLSSVDIGYMGGIDMLDADFGIAVGAGDFTAQIYRTTDGGATRPRVHFPSENDHILADIEMVDETIGWAVGYGPDGPEGQPGTAILGTTDGGLTWTREPINEATALLGVSMCDEHRGFTCGGYNLNISRVFRYDDGFYDGTGVEGGMNGRRVALAQNQPNPFNPRTTISFQLAGQEHVQLAVYDVSGREIAVLADRTFTDGMHEVVWHGLDDRGASVPSGVYFARCAVDGESESMKLVLLR